MDPDSYTAERRDWCRRADRLGIPWLETTDLEELKALVRDKEKTMKVAELVNGVWQIPGELPNGLEFKDGKFSVDGENQPECFDDMMWDDSPNGAEACHDCAFSPVCLERTAKIALPAVQARLGAGATLEALAEQLAITPASVLMLMAQAKGEALEPKRKKKPSEVPLAPAAQEVPPAPKALEPEPAKPVEVVAEVQPEQPVPEKPKKTKAAKPAKAKLKAKKEKPAKVAEEPQSSLPQVAPSVKCAKGGALPKKANAKTAKARAESSPEPWREHTFVDRFKRERQRSRLISRLVVGTVLTVERNGQKHVCQVIQNGYTYRGKTFPTLYSVTVEAAGTQERPRQLKADGSRPEGQRAICNWSAPKFWALDKVLSRV